MKSTIILFLALLTVSTSSFYGQDAAPKVKKEKEEFFFYWGYNRSAFARSDIRLHGKGYDFTMHNVWAKDKPEPFDAKIYFNPVKLSIPQFNTRLGWKMNDKLWISFGYDHMKYVLQNGQHTTISGTIDSIASQKYAGTYNNDSIKLANDFVQYEHTDGFNFITFDADYVSPLWSSEDKRFKLEHWLGLSAGVILPRTDVEIFSYEGPNVFNLAGYGLAIKSQLRFFMWKRLFVQVQGKAGIVNMPKIQTTTLQDEWAQQNIKFVEAFWAIGYQFRFGRP